MNDGLNGSNGANTVDQTIDLALTLNATQLNGAVRTYLRDMLGAGTLTIALPDTASLEVKGTFTRDGGVRRGRPAGTANGRGRPVGSGRKPGRPAKATGRKPGRPAGTGRKPGRPRNVPATTPTDAPKMVTATEHVGSPA